MFLVIEGPDNVGKTTQVQRLARTLEEDYSLNVVATREPGGTDFGMAVRELIMEHVDAIDIKAQYCLFLADRAQHMAEVVDPALGEGCIVVSDRFDLSTIAYVLAKHMLDPQEVAEMLAACEAVRSINPDLGIVLMPTGPYEAEALNRFDLIDYNELRICYQRAVHHVDYPCDLLWVEDSDEDYVTEKIIETLEERMLL